MLSQIQILQFLFHLRRYGMVRRDHDPLFRRPGKNIFLQGKNLFTVFEGLPVFPLRNNKTADPVAEAASFQRDPKRLRYISGTVYRYAAGKTQPVCPVQIYPSCGNRISVTGCVFLSFSGGRQRQFPNLKVR